jgi:hypothetical protein
MFNKVKEIFSQGIPSYRTSDTRKEIKRSKKKSRIILPLPVYVVLSAICLASSGGLSDYITSHNPNASTVSVSVCATMVFLSIFFASIAIIKIRNPRSRLF